MNNAGTREDTNTFEIGLVLAGAVSAGAYSAGVVNFLIEAIDQWYAAREDEVSQNIPPEQRKIPDHNVCIRTISGASAGSMVAALAAVALNELPPPIDPDHLPGPTDDTNKLYSSWVIKADIGSMLTTSDLKGKPSSLVSLLDSSFLKNLAEETIVIDRPYQSRTYVADRLSLFISITNLRGVPYSIDFQGPNVVEHGMSNHADFLRFDLVKPEARNKGSVHPTSTLLHPDPRNDEEKDAWKKLASAAVASGAFPIALAPRILKRNHKDYDERLWAIPLAEPKAENGMLVCTTREKIPPAWNGNPPDDYTFLAVDGGVMNNEPMEYARQELAGSKRHNERRGDKADRAVLMIDPFPDSVLVNAEYKEDPGLLSVAGAIFKSLMSQAKFKADDLKLARDPSVFSRFIISPTRDITIREMKKQKWQALASNALFHFGGFLDEEFRRHDFLLGRRNCQRFLQKYFVLPKNNALFKQWPQGLKETGSPYLQKRTIDGQEVDCLPIIPLVGKLTHETKQPTWPVMQSIKLKSLEKKLGMRTKMVLKRIASSLYVPKETPTKKSSKFKSALLRLFFLLFRPFIWLFLWWFSGWIKRKLTKKIIENLATAELLGNE